MTAINKALGNIDLGVAQVFENLTVTPLLAPSAESTDYLTLDDAQSRGLATVTEISEAGSVPTLLLENLADMALFLLDGEELLGAKQNRIVNLTLLVPPRTRLEIPVSCVEQGRWSHQSAEFASSDRAMFSRGRARKAARVSENMRARASRRSDQSEVWGDISEKMRSMRVESGTSALSDAFEHFAKPIDEYVDGIAIENTQVGACFAINGAIRGVELFDSSETCGKLMPKLVRSYALDAIDEHGQRPGEVENDVASFLNSVRAAGIDRFDALGEGEDLRLRSVDVSGGALSVRDRLIHLCAFPHESEADAVDPFRGAIRRASSRQRAHMRRTGNDGSRR